MFLSATSPDDGPHELDFRFEVFPEENRFLFAHHGAKLHELLEVCGLPSLGSTFYMVEMAYPLTLPDIIRDKRLLYDRYSIEPATVFGCYLRLQAEMLARFFENTRADTELDCTLIGTEESELSEQDFQRFLDAIKSGPGHIPLAGLRSWLHTHDNHFLWLGAKPLGLLRRLVAASLVGFFNHVHPHPYRPIPDDLIDVILSRYHTAPLICFPTAWDSSRATEVAGSVQVEDGEVLALLETGESYWIAYQLNPPKELLGRGLLLSYQFRSESWSYEELR